MGLAADAEVADVAVFDDVVFTLYAREGFGAAGSFSTVVDVVFPVSHFHADEVFFEVRVDLAGGDWCFAPLFDRPGAGFLDTTRDERDKTEELVGFLNEAIEAGLGLAREFEVFLFFFWPHRGKIRFHFYTDRDDRALETFDAGFPRAIGKLRFAYVYHVEHRLGREKVEGFKGEEIFFGPVERTDHGSRVEGGGGFFECSDFELEGFCHAALALLLGILETFGDRFHVRKGELGVDGLGITKWVYGTIDVEDIGIVEGAHDLSDGIGFADVGQEFIAETLAFGGTFYETGDIDELDDRWDEFLGFVDSAEERETFIRNFNHTDIGVDGTERIVGAINLLLSDSREESGFTNVWEADDADLESHILARSYGVLGRWARGMG